MELTRYLEGALSGMRGVKVILSKPTINILLSEFDPQIYDPRWLRQFAAKYRVVPELFMRDVAACPQRVYRFTLMPHVREATIDSFISDLSEALMRPMS